MADNSLPTSLLFHYIKSNYFRVVHVDGLIGGPTPSGLIFISLYNDRAAIPQMMVHDITEGGQIGAEHLDERVTKKGIVREVEVGLILSVETATSVIAWLQEKVDIINKMKATSGKGKEADEPSVH